MRREKGGFVALPTDIRRFEVYIYQYASTMYRKTKTSQRIHSRLARYDSACRDTHGTISLAEIHATHILSSWRRG